MKRVVIIGPGASGKSTLASQLSEITGLRVLELDKVFWQPGLVETPRDQWVALQQKLVGEDEWIMDGDLGHYDTIEVRLRAADTIVFSTGLRCILFWMSLFPELIRSTNMMGNFGLRTLRKSPGFSAVRRTSRPA